MKKNYYVVIVALVVLLAIILTARKQQERVVAPIVYNAPEVPVEVEDASDCGFYSDLSVVRLECSISTFSNWHRRQH
jgi:hypothetical protein